MIPCTIFIRNGSIFLKGKKNLHRMLKFNFFYHIRVASANSNLIADIHNNIYLLILYLYGYQN
jgi:hypothetical protein